MFLTFPTQALQRGGGRVARLGDFLDHPAGKALGDDVVGQVVFDAGNGVGGASENDQLHYKPETDWSVLAGRLWGERPSRYDRKCGQRDGAQTADGDGECSAACGTVQEDDRLCTVSEAATSKWRRGAWAGETQHRDTVLEDVAWLGPDTGRDVGPLPRVRCEPRSGRRAARYRFRLSASRATCAV